MVNSFIREEGPRHRDDGGAQRVRDGRELTRPACMLKRMQRVAYDWHNYGNSTIGNAPDIENVTDREPAGVLPHATTSRTTRCCWSPGKFDEAKALALVARGLRQDPEAHAQASRRSGRSSPRRTASASSASAARATCRSSWSAYKVPSAPAPGQRRHLLRRPTSSPTRRRAACTRRWWNAGQGRAGVRLPDRRGAAPGPSALRRGGEEGRPVEPVRDELIAHHRGLRDDARHGRGDLRARASNYENRVREDARQPRVDRRAAVRVHRAGRLAALLPRRATTSRKVTRRRGRQGGAAPTTAATTAPSGLYLPEDNPQRAEIPPRPRWPRC